MLKAQRNVVKYMKLSILLFAGTFVAVWASWALFPALAVVGLMLVAWFLGAMFATAIIPTAVYEKYANDYQQAVEKDEE